MADASASPTAKERHGATDVLLRILETLESRAPKTEAHFADAAAEATPSQNSKKKNKKEMPAGPRATLGALVDELDERAFGLLILVLALPCCLPFVYILPQIVAFPILFLAGQLAMGKTSPWLASGLRERDFPIATLKNTVGRASKYLGWAERFASARLEFLTKGIGVRIIGALMMIPAASILLPLPMTNTVPGIGVAIIALGLIERDGLAVLAGLVIGLLWVGLLGFLGAEGLTALISLIKDKV